MKFESQPMETMKQCSPFYEEELSPQSCCTYVMNVPKDQPQGVRSSSTPSETRVWLCHCTMCPASVVRSTMADSRETAE